MNVAGSLLIVALSAWCGIAYAEDLRIEIIRTRVVPMIHQKEDGTSVTVDALIGDIAVNGADIGRTVENRELAITAGTYPGYVRYVSSKNFVAGPVGTIGQRGDFLLELGKTEPRTNVLLHGGNRPWQSKGCILVGGVPKQNSVPFLSDDHVLARLRKAFYGTDDPKQSPRKSISITITDNTR